MKSLADPFGTLIPYKENNFEIGFLSSILHTFILILFAELGDKTFIMLFILQLRTNKVTIFYSALFAEILMNSLACFFGYLINYLLYKNLIDYLGIMFFVIYGIFLILWGFKKQDETFEIEFEAVDELIKQKTRRTSAMILGLDENDKNKNEDNNFDIYNLEEVNMINEKQYAPIIKKELTVIPEGDISREDSVVSDNNAMLLSGKKQKNNEDDDNNDFILGNKNSNDINTFNLKLRKQNIRNNSDKKLNKFKINDDVNNINNINKSAIHYNEEDIDNQENNEEKNNLRSKIRYKSRYYLDYFDKTDDTEKPYIDTSIFGTIFLTMCLSEFGDRTQLISLTSASIFHFWGSLLGSCTALFCSCLLGVYFSRIVVKNLKQKFIDFFLGILFLLNGIQIYYSKLKSSNAI
jgi:putative Ca2+/H+ antiporter (TMEM165/GDT1 family)